MWSPRSLQCRGVSNREKREGPLKWRPSVLLSIQPLLRLLCGDTESIIETPLWSTASQYSLELLALCSGTQCGTTGHLEVPRRMWWTWSEWHSKSFNGLIRLRRPWERAFQKKDLRDDLELGENYIKLSQLWKCYTFVTFFVKQLGQ